MDKYSKDCIDGVWVEPTVLNGVQQILDVHNGTVYVESGELTILGELKGTLSVKPGAKAIIQGKQSGTVAVSGDAKLIVYGGLSGTVSVSRGGVVIVESSGTIRGTLTNDGLVTLKGGFGGARTGTGRLEIVDSGYIKEPITRNGITYYEW